MGLMFQWDESSIRWYRNALKEYLVAGKSGFSYYPPYEKRLALFAIHI
jgi:hypothetical protein